MKHIFKYILAFVVLCQAMSCKMELNPYDYERNRLNFLYPADTTSYLSDPDVNFSFVYIPLDIEYDTIWIPVRTMGFVTEYDRKVTFRQGESEEPMAVPGRHYVPFNNEQLIKNHYTVKAGKNSALIPVVAIRAPELEEQVFTLLLEIASNEDFDVGYPDRSSRLVYLSNMLVKPPNWDMMTEFYFAGTYGKVKHQFMIDCVRDRGMVIDEEWITSVMGTSWVPDISLTSYWAGYFTDKLTELNRQRAEDNLDVLREEPNAANPEGLIVRFNDQGAPQPYI